MTVVTFSFAGLGWMGSADRYRREFDNAAAAREFSERVLEGHAEARWRVRCESGAVRRLGTCTSATTVHLIDRKTVAA